MDLEQLEVLLRSLLKGEHSSLTIGFNDGNGPNYETVGGYIEAFGGNAEGHTEWVSEDERAKAIETNSWWCAQWYPQTPVGFCSLSASTLPALIVALAEPAAPR